MQILSIRVTDLAGGVCVIEMDEEVPLDYKFEIDRRPDFTFNAQTFPPGVPQIISGTYHYTLQIPSPGPALPVGGLWYVRVMDGAYALAAALKPVWFRESLISIYTSGGLALADIIRANAPGIDVMLQAVDEKLAFQTSIYGMEWNMGAATPGVLVRPYSCQENYFTLPRGRLLTMQYQVTAVVRSNDAANDAEAVGQLVEALVQILNQTSYETFVLPDKTPVNGGESTGHQYGSDFLDNIWAATGSFLWKWECVRYTA